MKLKTFLKCLFTSQLFMSLPYVAAIDNEYIYSVEETYSDIGDEGEIEDGMGLDGFVPLEFGKEHKQTFTSTRIIDIGAIRDHQLQRFSSTVESISSDSLKYDEENSVTIVVYNEKIFQSKLSWSGDFMLGSFLIVLGLFSLVGNGCILCVFRFRRRRLTPSEVLLVNLGTVDILLFVASYPMAIISSFKHRWDFGELGCTLYGFVCYFLGLSSIFSITAIALIRYWKTCCPARGNQITSWTSYKIIGWGCMFALVWAIPPLIGFGSYGPEPYGLSCTLDWVARDNASRIYIILVTIFCVFLPLILILFCYCRIILLVRQSDALVRNSGVKKRNARVSDVQLTWISGLVTLGFIIGWGPYSVVSLWASFRGDVILPMWLTPLPVILAKSSIAYNPLIYIFLTARYRADFINLCRYCIRSYSKISSGKGSRNGAGRSSQNANTGNNNTKESAGSSSLLTRQLTIILSRANSSNNNNKKSIGIPSPVNCNHQKLNDEIDPSKVNPEEVEATNIGITENKLYNVNPNVPHGATDLSIVIVGEVHANSQVITIINRVSPTKKICARALSSFQNKCVGEQV